MIEVAEPLAHRREATLEAAGALLWPVAGMMPVSLVAVWWLVGTALRPLRAFAAEIGTRGSADLSPIAVQDLPDETIPVIDAVNRLLHRLRRVLEAERRFSANSAHELRTPLAAALAQTQRLLAEAPDGALRNRAERIESSLRQLSRTAEKLMQLAKAEGGGLLSSAPHNLAPVLTHVVDQLALAPEARERIRLQVSRNKARPMLIPMPLTF
jgi:two-component system OmpR family sensor kinase